MTTMPSTGRDWNTVSGTSPVPGGISTNIKSISFQIMSVQNCCTAPAIIGPRQITGSSAFSSSRLMEQTSIPVLVAIGNTPSSVAPSVPVKPKPFGMDGPVISASRIPQCAPLRCMAMASREVHILLPTPPLPLTTPMTFLMLDSGCGALSRDSGSPQLPPQLSQSWLHPIVTSSP